MISHSQFQKNVAFLGIDSDKMKRGNAINMRTVFSFFCLSWAMLATYMPFFSEIKDIMVYIILCYCASSTTTILILFLILLWRMKTIFAFIDSVDSVIEKRLKCPISKTIYKSYFDMENKWCTIISFLFVRVSPVIALFPMAMYSFYTYETTEIGRDALQLPLPVWYPFDTKNPFGFCLCCFLLYLNVSLIIFTANLIICLAFGTITSLLSSINDIVGEMKRYNERAQTPGDRLARIKEMGEFVELHGVLKQLFRDASPIYEPLNMVLSLWSMLAMCSTPLMLELGLTVVHETDSLAVQIITLVSLITPLFWSFVLFYISCEIGEIASDACDHIGYDIGQFNWYTYPIEVQKLIYSFIMMSQERCVIKIFGSITVCRDTFRSVYKGASTYFLALRRIEH